MLVNPAFYLHFESKILPHRPVVESHIHLACLWHSSCHFFMLSMSAELQLCYCSQNQSQQLKPNQSCYELPKCGYVSHLNQHFKRCLYQSQLWLWSLSGNFFAMEMLGIAHFLNSNSFTSIQRVRSVRNSELVGPCPAKFVNFSVFTKWFDLATDTRCS